MSKKSPTYKNFVQMTGYKDVFYNPIACSKRNQPSPIIVETPNNNLVKSIIAREPEIESYKTGIDSRIFRSNIIDRRKVNSKITKFIFPLSPTKSPNQKIERPELERKNLTNECNDLSVYENIKSKIIDTIFYESSEKKFELINNIISFLKDNNIPEDKLINFLDLLQKS